MAKKSYAKIGIIVLIILVIILLAAVVVIKAPSLLGTTPTTTQGNTSTNNMTVTTDITAFRAVSIAGNNSVLAGWRAGKTGVTLSRLYSSHCENGSASSWTAVYDSDQNEALVTIDNGNVTIASDTPRTPDMAHAQNIQVAGLVDSDRAAATAATAVATTPMRIAGPMTMELVTDGSGAYKWDISYPVDNGYYVVYVDAKNGNILQSTYSDS